MSREQFQDDCPGCRPVGTNLDGTPLPKNHALNVALSTLWENTDRPTKAAFHRCTCLNGRDPADLALCTAFLDQVRNRLSN
jgi:hypothetical protein